MNKLEGLFELKNICIPAVDWKIYTHKTVLDDRYLWTIRSAVYTGKDINLPKLFGKDAVTSKLFADNLLNKLGNNGIVIYYPYLIAEKSGNLQIGKDRIVIEAVQGDLSNLLIRSKVDATYIWNENNQRVLSDEHFFSSIEIKCILKYAKYLKTKYANILLLGNEVQLEFSFACKCSRQGKKIGEPELVFFEIRTV